MTKIPVWQMIHEAVNAMTKEVSPEQAKTPAFTTLLSGFLV